MKRQRGYSTAAGRPFKRPRQTALPKRSYAKSRVPLRSGGYRPNRVEKKVADTAPAVHQINTSGEFTLLALPTLGSDMNNRIGRKILLKSFYIRGSVATEASNITTLVSGQNVGAQLCRMIIFADMQPNGAAPAVTDVLNTSTPVSQLNLNNRDRFKIYSDKTWAFDPMLYNTTATSAVASCSRQIYTIKKFKKINLEVVFNGTNGGTVADINSGALIMMLIGDHAAGAGADANANLSVRVRYTDI